MDFMHYAMDQICNHCAIMNFTFGGHVPVPITIRAIINRGGEQAAQHSQALQGIFMHIPGLKVVMPSDPYDAKGLLIAAVEDNNPVIYIDDRWLYELEGEVPEAYYSVPIGKAKTLSRGNDVTLVATSYMVIEAEKACRELEKAGVSIELIDLRSIKPVDEETILNSVSKTGCLVIADAGWKTAGVAAEISAIAASDGFDYLRYPIQRVTLPDVPAPASITLEQEFYPSYLDIIKKVKQTLERGRS
jgi:pyruvate dehydrogenase E1 component beta subunit